MASHDYTSDVTRIMAITGLDFAATNALVDGVLYQDREGTITISGRRRERVWLDYSDRIDAQQARAAAPKTTGERTNAYPGVCVDCRAQVRAGEGLLLKDGDRWVVRHRDCAAQARAAGTGWSDAAIRRAGGSVYAARTGTHGECQDCGAAADLIRGLCWGCRNI